MPEIEPYCQRDDLELVLAGVGRHWDCLRDKTIFITGGTGFFGSWLVDSFRYANDRLGLGSSVVVLTRNASRFHSDHAVRFVTGAMQSFDFLDGEYPFIIHAATEDDWSRGPLHVFKNNVDGTARVLEFARTHGTRRVLFISSGAVYGNQPPDLPAISECYAGAPDPLDPSSAYGNSKRTSEYLCISTAARHSFDAVIARCFAFVGPHLPMDSNYAIGNFIRDALAGGPIRVMGDGTPRRSYLYAVDLAVWLWTLLIAGVSGRAYNVGSSEDIAIGELAAEVADVVQPSAAVEIAHRPVPGIAPTRYVPCTRRAESELGLRVNVPRREAIRRTAAWKAGLWRSND